MKPTLKWLSDIDVFQVNRLPAHSDHKYYGTMEEARKKGRMNFQYSLNGTWKFSYAVNPSSRIKDFYKNDFDCSGWDTIQVPGHIQLQGYGKPHYVNTMYPWDGYEELRPPQVSTVYNPVGSYIKHFEVPKHMQDMPLFISFQGVETAFYVWLNGEFIGYSEDSFTPADFELTPYVKEGKNKLAVEVYQRSTGSWLEDQDFWRFSGIFRDVYLYVKPEIHVDDLHVKTDLDDSYKHAALHVDLKLSNHQEGNKVKLILEDANQNVIGTTEKNLSSANETLKLSVSNPRLWSAEDPYLYEAYIQIFNKDDELVEVIPQYVGFRRFEMKNNLMLINGKRIVFNGVNRHEFNCHHGRAISKEDMLKDIKILKQNNINAVRTSHYPNQSYWYELCDIYGIYVIDEVNLETHGSWQKLDEIEPSWVIPGNREEWKDIVLDRAKSMFERDKNHPSILIWSCGNESYGGKVIYEMSEYFRKVDPSRLVHYEGIFNDRTYNDTSDMESRMYAKPAEIEEYLNSNPEKPFIVCEYMHAMGNSVGGMKKYTDLAEKYPMYQGGFIWDYIDQAIMKKDRYGKEHFAYGGDFDDRPTDYSFCTNGIVFADRKLTPQMQEVKFLYQNFELLPDRNGVKVINKQLFKDTSNLYLKYTLSQDGEIVYTGKLEEVDVAAESETYLKFELPITEEGEYVIRTSIHLKEDTLWAERGHEVAFGEYIFQNGRKTYQIPEGNVEVINGDVNIGVRGEEFHVMFSRKIGSLVSLQYSGREMIKEPPKPLFWRALTDNDRGNLFGFTSGAWYAASFLPKCIDVSFEDKGSHATIHFLYALSIHKESRVKISYTVYANGNIRVAYSYKGVKGLPDIPIHAVSFKTSPEYENLEWYAKGPEENYIDRSNGARLTTFANKVKDNLASYSVPQESGNRTGVRRLSITDNKGRGIRISASGEPLECNVSPYTAFELENAKHHYELPDVHYTVVTVAGKQMGVGGDDSWGAPVHEEFRISGEEDFNFEFMIEPIQ